MKLIRLCVCLLMLSALVSFSGCFNRVGPDVTAPAVVSVEPAADSLHILIDTVVLLHFSEEIDLDTVTAETILIADSFGNVVTGSLSAGVALPFRWMPLVIVAGLGDNLHPGFTVRIRPGVRRERDSRGYRSCGEPLGLGLQQHLHNAGGSGSWRRVACPRSSR